MAEKIGKFGAGGIFLACVIFFYRREGKLFSEEIFILRRKTLIALATLNFFITTEDFISSPLLSQDKNCYLNMIFPTIKGTGEFLYR